MSLNRSSIPVTWDKIYLNGQYVPSESQDTLTLINPKNDELIAQNIPISNKADVDKAVEHAESAFKGPWASFSSAQRAECLRRLADLLDKKLPEILQLDSLTTGNPVSLIPTREKSYIKNCLLYYAGWADKHKGDYFPPDDGIVKLVRHEPLGVCAAINPYNSPVASLFIKAAPCLASGNVLIVKPSEKSPLGSLAVAPLFEKAGIPPGVLQVLPGDGQTGELLAKHMKIRKISFTGSVATGKKIQVAAAESNLKRVTLELGGKSPMIVFEDADIDNAVTWAVNGIMARSGQVCVAASRVYVHHSILDTFLLRYVKSMEAAALEMGDPQDANIRYGPLVDKAAFERVHEMIELAKTEAELVVGGHQLGTTGCFIAPTVFVNPKPNAEIYKKEVFGPVSVVKSFETEEEVLAKANDTEYGLMAGVFTRDISRALRVSDLVESGVVGINCVSLMSIQAPFGGKKASGIGREFGEYVSEAFKTPLRIRCPHIYLYALRGFTEPKTILINMNSS